ncbi:MAG: hypothetical protein NUW37_04480 [Planctomycetes bacterium]|nr:hypothetical protein [Planctomycetota bacterium]
MPKDEQKPKVLTDKDLGTAGPGFGRKLLSWAFTFVLAGVAIWFGLKLRGERDQQSSGGPSGKPPEGQQERNFDLSRGLAPEIVFETNSQTSSRGIVLSTDASRRDQTRFVDEINSAREMFISDFLRTEIQKEAQNITFRAFTADESVTAYVYGNVEEVKRKLAGTDYIDVAGSAGVCLFDGSLVLKASGAFEPVRQQLRRLTVLTLAKKHWPTAPNWWLHFVANRLAGAVKTQRGITYLDTFWIKRGPFVQAFKDFSDDSPEAILTAGDAHYMNVATIPEWRHFELMQFYGFISSKFASSQRRFFQKIEAGESATPSEYMMVPVSSLPEVFDEHIAVSLTIPLRER